MEKVEYPKWKYHPNKEAIIVHSKQEERKLGSAWVDSPADYPKKDLKNEAGS